MAKRLQPVVWSKGTFLTPQHLQIQDRFAESCLQFRLDALNFCPWGFSALLLDQEALAAGSLSITRATGIFPDGLLFDIPDSDPAPPPKPLEHYFDQAGHVAFFSLAIPPYREGGLNISAEPGGADTRYLAEVATVRDELSARTEKPLQVARKNFRILEAGEVRRGTPALSLAAVRKTQSGAFQADSLFIPPLLDIGASDAILSIVRRLVEILTAKSGQIAGFRRQKNQSLADFTASDVANFWLLYTVNGYLPVLRHLFETRRGHPERLYAGMLSIAGALTTFSSEIRPRDLPAYDHNSLGECFRDLDQKLRTLLETVVPSNFVALPLRAVQPFIWAAALDEDRYLANTRLYLAVRAGVGEAEVIRKTPALVKVCSANHIEHLVRHALPGVELTHVPNPPRSIPIKLDYQYFSLSQSGVAWEAIGRARNLAAYVPAELPDPRLELIILLPQAA